MGYWSHEIFGSDDALDALCAVEREVMGRRRLEPFDWDRETREALLSHANSLQLWALERAHLDTRSAENATAVAFLLFGLAVGCEPTDEIRERSREWFDVNIKDAEFFTSYLQRGKHSEGVVETLRALPEVTSLDHLSARSIAGSLWYCDGMDQALSVAFTALGGGERPLAVEGYVDILKQNLQSVPSHYREIRGEALSFADTWSLENGIDVITVGALLTSVGHPLRLDFIGALEIAAARDLHPDSSAPERALVIDELLRASRSRGAILPSFTNYGLGAAFDRTAQNGGGLVNILPKKRSSH